MRRLLMGLVWFVVLWIGGGGIGGAIAAAIANAKAPAQNFREGYASGHDVGYEFGRRYGGMIMLAALGISIAGTATGRLPGTRKQATASETSDQGAPSSSSPPRPVRPGSPPARTVRGVGRIGLVVVLLALVVVGSLGILRRAAEEEMAELGGDPVAPSASGRPTSPAGLPRSAPEVAAAGGTGTTGSELDVQLKLRVRDFHALDAILAAKQAALEQDVRREWDLVHVTGAFGVADPTLTPLLDAWVAAEPTAWPPRLARAEHRIAVAWQRRGAKVAKETSGEQFAGMRETLAGAVADARDALEQNPKLTEAYRTLVVAATGYGDREACVRLAERAVAVAPATLRVRVALAQCLLPRWGGSYESVAALAREAQRYAGQNPGLKALLGYVDWDRGRVAKDERHYEDALTLYTKALEAGELWQFYDDRAELYRRQNRYTEALADVARALALAPEQPDALVRRAMILVPLKRHEDALADVKLASELDPTNDLLLWFRRTEGEAAVNQGYQLLETKDVKHAIERLTWAIEMTPDSADAFYWRGRAYMRTNDQTRALPDFEEAVRLNPRHFESYVNLDWLLAQRGDWDGVIERWTRFLNLEPLNGQAYLERGGAYRHKGDQQAALADARKACELGNRDACQIIGHATARQ